MVMMEEDLWDDKKSWQEIPGGFVCEYNLVILLSMCYNMTLRQQRWDQSQDQISKLAIALYSQCCYSL